MERSDEDRVEGRRWAEEVLSDLSAGTDDFREGFWRVMKKTLETREVPKNTVMSDEQSKAFGKRIVEFGKFFGKRYDDVPLDYLEWLSDQGSELRRYLSSRRIREEGRDG